MHALQAAREGAIVAALAHEAVLSLRGPDARRWANGMFTQNVRDLAPGQGAASAFCDDRGRVLGLMHLYCAGPDAFVIVLEGGDSEGFAQRFAKFLIFDDVEIEPLALAVVTVQGPRAAQVLAAAGIAVPTPESGPDWVAAAVGGTGRRDRSLAGGFDVLVADGDAVRAALLEAGASAGEAVLERLRIEQGRPAWPADIGDRAFPHELGLRDQVLHFRKGCYVGQEIINRMETRAKVRRHLRGVHLEGEPSADVVLVGDQAVGSLTSKVAVEDGWLGLSILKEPHDAPGTEILVGGQKGHVVALPLQAPEQ